MWTLAQTAATLWFAQRHFNVGIEIMKPISRAAVVLGLILLFCSLISLVNPLWLTNAQYNDVGPAPLALLSLLAWGLSIGVPVLAVPAIIISGISLARDHSRQWGVIGLALCTAACSIIAITKNLEERENSQHPRGHIFQEVQ